MELEVAFATRLPFAPAQPPPFRPYTEEEIAALRQWADIQPEPLRAQCHILLALGAGCGLRADEALRVCLRDVRLCSTHLIAVQVTGPRERLPVVCWIKLRAGYHPINAHSSVSRGWVMTNRLPCPVAPGPLEDYAARFDDLFSALGQRRGFREYLAGLLLPRERNKTLTCLAGAEPVAESNDPAVGTSPKAG